MARNMRENDKLYRARIVRLVPARPEETVPAWRGFPENIRPAVPEGETLDFAGPYLHSAGASQAIGRARTSSWGPKLVEDKSFVEVFDPTAGTGWVRKSCRCCGH